MPHQEVPRESLDVVCRQIDGKQHPRFRDGGRVDRRIARVAAAQFGVVSRTQLRAAGISEQEIDVRLRTGRLHGIHRGVFAVGHTRITDHAHLVAALLATGPEAFLSHRSAAAVWGLRVVAVREIHVTIRSTGVRQPAGLVLHRTRRAPHAGDIRIRNDLRVSSVPRLIVELAPQEKPDELRRLVTQAIRKQVLDIPQMEAALGRHARRPGIGKARKALEGYLSVPSGVSNLENEVAAWLAELAWIPHPERNVAMGQWELDFYWPQFQLVLETDGGPYHSTIGDIERAHAKDAWLQQRGLKVMRVTGWQFDHNRRPILDALRGFMDIAA